MTDFFTFKATVDSLFAKKGMLPGKKSKVIILSFYNHFLAQAWRYHSEYGDGVQMLNILLNDSSLIGGEQFNKNFYGDIPQQKELKFNKTWNKLKPSIIRFNGERIGAGEFYFPFVIQGWKFQKDGGTSDGYVAGGKREIKFGQASLKPIANASHRVIDDLTATVFEGNRVGPLKPNKNSQGQSFERWLAWFDQRDNKEQKLLEFFTPLYLGQDVGPMCKKLIDARACKDFYYVVGSYVIMWYKDIDNFDSLILIDIDKMKMANIADVSDLTMFPTLKFDWVTKRGGDIRQLADGYVNVKI